MSILTNVGICCFALSWITGVLDSWFGQKDITGLWQMLSSTIFWYFTDWSNNNLDDENNHWLQRLTPATPLELFHLELGQIYTTSFLVQKLRCQPSLCTYTSVTVPFRRLLSSIVGSVRNHSALNQRVDRVGEPWQCFTLCNHLSISSYSLWKPDTEIPPKTTWLEQRSRCPEAEMVFRVRGTDRGISSPPVPL